MMRAFVLSALAAAVLFASNLVAAGEARTPVLPSPPVPRPVHHHHHRQPFRAHLHRDPITQATLPRLSWCVCANLAGMDT
jgi:hypothetical protein